MDLDRQPVRIPEEGHRFSREGILTDRLTGNSHGFQLPDLFGNTVNAEGKMPKAVRLRV